MKNVFASPSLKMATSLHVVLMYHINCPLISLSRWWAAMYKLIGLGLNANTLLAWWWNETLKVFTSDPRVSSFLYTSKLKNPHLVGIEYGDRILTWKCSSIQNCLFSFICVQHEYLFIKTNWISYNSVRQFWGIDFKQHQQQHKNLSSFKCIPP